MNAELAERIAEVRAGVGDPEERAAAARKMVAAVRAAVLVVPRTDGALWTTSLKGVRWVCAFTDGVKLNEFAQRHVPPGTSWELGVCRGENLMAVIIPAMEGPRGLALDLTTEDSVMFFPPVTDLVPENVVVNVRTPGEGSTDTPAAD